MPEITYTNNYAVIKTHTHGGRKAWIAAITGRDAKYGLRREFLSRHDVTLAEGGGKSNTYRTIEILVPLTPEGAIYEYGNMDSSSTGGSRGFWAVVNGKLKKINRIKVIEEVENGRKKGSSRFTGY